MGSTSGLVEDHPDWYSNDGTHFNVKGKAAQGMEVADSLVRSLSAGEAKRDER